MLIFTQNDEFDLFGIDWDGPLPCDGAEAALVEVPNMVNPERADAILGINPLRESQFNGVDIYMDVLNIL